MQQDKEKAQPRRVKIGIAYGTLDRIKTELFDFCCYANDKIIPAMQALDLPVTLQSVIHYAAEPAKIRTDYIESQLEESAPGVKGALRQMVIERLDEQIEELTSIPDRRLRTKYENLLRFDSEGVVTYSGDGAIEAAGIWLTDPQQLAAYDRHIAAVEAMNAFFKGNAPDTSGLRSYFYSDEKGNVIPAECVDYRNFI